VAAQTKEIDGSGKLACVLQADCWGRSKHRPARAPWSVVQEIKASAGTGIKNRAEAALCCHCCKIAGGGGGGGGSNDARDSVSCWWGVGGSSVVTSVGE
jgi:hypothetical protein